MTAGGRTRMASDNIYVYMDHQLRSSQFSSNATDSEYGLTPCEVTRWVVTTTMICSKRDKRTCSLLENAKENNTRDSNVVPHRSTNRARTCLTSQSRRDVVLSCWYGRSRKGVFKAAIYNLRNIRLRKQTYHTFFILEAKFLFSSRSCRSLPYHLWRYFLT